VQRSYQLIQLAGRQVLEQLSPGNGCIAAEQFGKVYVMTSAGFGWFFVPFGS
jgi:hypothetical protein